MYKKANWESGVITKKKEHLSVSLWLLLAIAGLATLVISVVCYVFFKHSNSSIVNATKQIQPQKLEVLALGRLEPEGEIINLSGLVGEKVAKLNVKEGDKVKAGAVIAYLDNHQQMLAQWNLAKSQLEEIKERIANDSLLKQAQIDQAQTQIDSASTPTLSQIYGQKALVRRLEAEQINAKQEYSRWQYLHLQGAVSLQALDSRKLTIDSAVENLNQARQTLDQLVSNRQINIASAKSELRAAQVNKQRVYTDSGLPSAIANLKLVQRQLERTIIHAPRNGEILKILTKEGEAIPQTGTILQMGNTKQMYVVAEVYETDISLIKPGQKAMITSPALPTPVMGVVAKIGKLIYKNNLIGDDPAADTDARVVEVKVRLNNENNLASNLSNLKVDVKIQLNSKQINANH